MLLFQRAGGLVSVPAISWFVTKPSTYDHRQRRTRGPVCSPIDKPLTGRLVVGWVTTSEHRLLYVFVLFCFFHSFFFFSSSWMDVYKVTEKHSPSSAFDLMRNYQRQRNLIKNMPYMIWNMYAVMGREIELKGRTCEYSSHSRRTGSTIGRFSRNQPLIPPIYSDGQTDRYRLESDHLNRKKR